MIQSLLLLSIISLHTCSSLILVIYLPRAHCQLLSFLDPAIPSLFCHCIHPFSKFFWSGPNVTPTGPLTCAHILSARKASASLTITLGIQADPKSVNSPLAYPVAYLSGWRLTQDICGLTHRYVFIPASAFVRIDMRTQKKGDQPSWFLRTVHGLSINTLLS